MKISIHNLGNFKLDGGAMFGSVPKTLWNKVYPCDDKNRIELATNCLLIETENRKILVDVGMGNKWDNKLSEMYDVRCCATASWKFKADEITDVILTHLHFDHAGGISKLSTKDEPELTFPNANIYLQSSHWEYAQSPSLKDKASFLIENILPVSNGKLILVENGQEILPGIFGHCANGHTIGQQWIEIRTENKIYLFPTDVVPTSKHIHVPYHLGYDLCAKTLLDEKAKLLDYAVRKEAIVIFEHDPQVSQGMIVKDAQGRFCLSESIKI